MLNFLVYVNGSLVSVAWKVHRLLFEETSSRCGGLLRMCCINSGSELIMDGPSVCYAWPQTLYDSCIYCRSTGRNTSAGSRSRPFPDCSYKFDYYKIILNVMNCKCFCVVKARFCKL